MNQRGVACVEHALKMLESCVEVSNLRVLHHEFKSVLPVECHLQLPRALQMRLKALKKKKKKKKKKGGDHISIFQ